MKKLIICAVVCTATFLFNSCDNYVEPDSQKINVADNQYVHMYYILNSTSYDMSIRNDKDNSVYIHSVQPEKYYLVRILASDFSEIAGDSLIWPDIPDTYIQIKRPSTKTEYGIHDEYKMVHFTRAIKESPYWSSNYTEVGFNKDEMSLDYKYISFDIEKIEKEGRVRAYVLPVTEGYMDKLKAKSE
ncbi:MAG: hypothetical protein IJ776_06595 [Paludibacteraceae bacterium]|nr:hypothetical protein [Paludibacteraceae bacterium]